MGLFRLLVRRNVNINRLTVKVTPFVLFLFFSFSIGLIVLWNLGRNSSSLRSRKRGAHVGDVFDGKLRHCECKFLFSRGKK